MATSGASNKRKYTVKNLSDFRILPQSFSRVKSKEKVKKKLLKRHGIRLTQPPSASLRTNSWRLLKSIWVECGCQVLLSSVQQIIYKTYHSFHISNRFKRKQLKGGFSENYGLGRCTVQHLKALFNEKNCQTLKLIFKN